MTVLHYRGGGGGGGVGAVATTLKADALLLPLRCLALMHVICKAEPGIDARARIKWLNTLSRLILRWEKAGKHEREAGHRAAEPGWRAPRRAVQPRVKSVISAFISVICRRLPPSTRKRASRLIAQFKRIIKRARTVRFYPSRAWSSRAMRIPARNWRIKFLAPMEIDVTVRRSSFLYVYTYIICVWQNYLCVCMYFFIIKSVKLSSVVLSALCIIRHWYNR